VTRGRVAFGEDENGSDRVGIVLGMCCNAPLVEFIVLYNASVGQSRGVEDANLQKK
jgi:hypothetical protein